MVNQKNRAKALKMLVTRRIFSFSSDARNDLCRGMSAVAEANQGVGKCPVGVHRHVTGDVVEDVRLRQIIERRAVPDGDRGGKFAVAQAVEEQEGRDVAAHRLVP